MRTQSVRWFAPMGVVVAFFLAGIVQAKADVLSRLNEQGLLHADRSLVKEAVRSSGVFDQSLYAFVQGPEEGTFTLYFKPSAALTVSYKLAVGLVDFKIKENVLVYFEEYGAPDCLKNGLNTWLGRELDSDLFTDPCVRSLGRLLADSERLSRRRSGLMTLH